MRAAVSSRDRGRAEHADDEAPRAVDRVFRLVEVLSRHERGLTLAELAAELVSPKSSVLRLARAMVRRGYLAAAEGRYILGPEIFRFAGEVALARRFPAAIRPVMEDLVTSTREAVYLAILDRDARLVTYAEVIDSPEPVRYAAPAGVQRPLYCSAAGRVLLAFQSEAWQAEYIRSTALKPITQRTIGDRKALREELRRIRATGVSVSIGEAVDRAAGIAAPIFGADGAIIGALLVGGPADRMVKEIPSLRPIIKNAAAAASAIMGAPAGSRPRGRA